MIETPVLPELWKCQLDQQALDPLWADLQNHAVILEIKEKSSASEYAQHDATAFDRFRSGQTHAIQICYRYDDKDWCDTILRCDSGYQLIRMNEPVQRTSE